MHSPSNLSSNRLLPDPPIKFTECTIAEGMSAYCLFREAKLLRLCRLLTSGVWRGLGRGRRLEVKAHALAVRMKMSDADVAEDLLCELQNSPLKWMNLLTRHPAQIGFLPLHRHGWYA